MLPLVAPDEPLRQALGRRETIQASTNAIAMYATVRHGSGRNSSSRIRTLQATGEGNRQPAACGTSSVTGSAADGAAAAVAVAAERADQQQHDRDDDGNLEREHEEPAEHDRQQQRG